MKSCTVNKACKVKSSQLHVVLESSSYAGRAWLEIDSEISWNKNLKQI